MQPIARPTYSKEELLNDYWGYVQKNIQQYADKKFIISTKGALTYAVANRRANIIYAAIRELTDVNGCGVGLFLKDPLEVIPAMIGVLKSGNYFIPLDVGFPESTLLSMVRTAEIKAVLTNHQYSAKIGSLSGATLAIINLDDLDFASHMLEPVVRYSPEDVVQILFTSGSSGEPKGAVEDYRYLIRAVLSKWENFYYEPEDRHLQLSTFTFSGPHTRVFTTLASGNSLYYYDLKADGMAGLPRWIRQQEITFYSSTPTVFRSFVSTLNPVETFPSVRKFSGGGEKKLHSDIQAVKRHFPNVEKIRLGFGSTETQNVTSSYFPIDHDFSQQNLPSGKPAQGIQVFIWDEQGNALPTGQEGEIVVYGDALARGYINDPSLTRERFLPDPSNPGWQYFKTGDLGKLLPDGQLVHLGRIDNMVKIKGVRIELDAIENHLLSYPGIVQVASRAFDDPKGNKKLASYFVPEEGIQIPVSDLRKHLAEHLPRHLLPHFLVPLNELPTTGNGKVATTQLPIPLLTRPELANPYVAPADDLEQQLVQIWEAQIGISGIGVTDDFFDVGGDSLIGVLLFVCIEEALGRNLPVSLLLTATSIRKQADLIRGHETAQVFSPLIPVTTGDKRPPLFFIPGKGGNPTRIRQLAKLLDSQTPIYGLQDLMTPGQGRALHSIESVASFYLNEIRKIHPQGPYVLVGESMGGKIAYEMAQQLLKLGQAAPILALLDTYNLEESLNMHPGKKYPLSYYKMLLEKHTTILIKSDWQGRLDYLRFYGETGWQKIKAFLNRRKNSLKNTSPLALPDRLRQMENRNRAAAREYNPPSYPGRVLLFKALRGPNANTRANGWDRVNLGALVIHPLDCYHGSVLFEPAISQLARILQTYIDQLE